MPTRYTEKLMESGQTFQEFILECTKQFIIIQDNPDNMPIPDKFKPSKYTIKKLIQLKKKLERFKSMNAEEIINFNKKSKTKKINFYIENYEKALNENNLLRKMEIQVYKWIPPTKKHQKLKDFMLQQINISKNDIDFLHTLILIEKTKSETSYYTEAIENILKDIKYYITKKEKEIIQAQERTEWMQELKLSI